MTTRRLMVCAVYTTLLATTGVGGEITPRALLEKTAATYQSLQTYKAEGAITADIDTGGMKMGTVTSFSMLLKKPNQYLISWTQKNVPKQGMSQSGTVWSDGSQPYLYMGVMNAYSKMASDEAALGGATGISGGAAFTIPSLFLPAFKKQTTPFARLTNPTIGKPEMVEGEKCFVVSGASTISKEETFWISQTSYLIRKYSRSLEAPEGGVVIPEMSDEDLEGAIKGTGQEVTDESKKRMREMMESSKAMIKNMKMSGSTVEVHAHVSSPELDAKAFTFVPPEGAVLKDALFGAMFNGSGAP